MALSIYTPSAARRKRFVGVSPTVAGAQPSPAVPRSPTPHLDAHQYLGLLDFIEREGGIVTLDEVSRAFPAVQHPVSAVFDLCDSEVLCVDLAAAFDGSMCIWRKNG